MPSIDLMAEPVRPPSRGECPSAAFAALVARVRGCRLCPRMSGRTRLLGRANGPAPAGVLFLAEAPGRLGGDRTAIPLSGDQSGRNFERLLAAAGLSRDEIFITNAVLCNPRDARGRNAPPSQRELANCRAHLKATITLVAPRLIVTLGAVALRAIGAIEPHGLRLADHAGQPRRWRDHWLVPLYHPGPRALIHRPLDRQLEDYQRLGEFARGLGVGPHPLASSPNTGRGGVSSPCSSSTGERVRG